MAYQFFEGRGIGITHVATDTIPRFIIGRIVFRVFWMLVAPFRQCLVVFCAMSWIRRLVSSQSSSFFHMEKNTLNFFEAKCSVGELFL